MQQKSLPSQDTAELELALEKSRRLPAFRTLLVLFWGLIMAKCLLAQWAVTVYHAPINTKFYVWTLSLAGSGALTLSYAWMVFREFPTMPLSGRLVSATWAACATGFGVLAAVAWLDGVFDPFLLPALAAILLGVGCHIQSVVDRKRLFRVLAIAWWVAAVMLFLQANINALAWMSGYIFVLIVAPAGWLFLKRPS